MTTQVETCRKLKPLLYEMADSTLYKQLLATPKDRPKGKAKAKKSKKKTSTSKKCKEGDNGNEGGQFKPQRPMVFIEDVDHVISQAASHVPQESIDPTIIDKAFDLAIEFGMQGKIEIPPTPEVFIEHFKAQTSCLFFFLLLVFFRVWGASGLKLKKIKD